MTLRALLILAMYVRVYYVFNVTHWEEHFKPQFMEGILFG